MVAGGGVAESRGWCRRNHERGADLVIPVPAGIQSDRAGHAVGAASCGSCSTPVLRLSSLHGRVGAIGDGHAVIDEGRTLDEDEFGQRVVNRCHGIGEQ